MPVPVPVVLVVVIAAVLLAAPLVTDSVELAVPVDVIDEHVTALGTVTPWVLQKSTAKLTAAC